MIDVRIVIAICFASYLLGSIPFGEIVGKRKGVDIRKAGSHNIGATNVGRLLGPWCGVLVGGLDGWKAIAPVVVTASLSPQSWWPAGLVWFSAFLGHLFPPWSKFKGGKGVSVFFAGLIGLLNWQTCLVILALWLVILSWSRRVDATNLLITAGILFFLPRLPVLLFLWPITLSMTILIIWAHRDNIRKLWNREGSFVKEPPLNKIVRLYADGVVLVVRKIEAF